MLWMAHNEMQIAGHEKCNAEGLSITSLSKYKDIPIKYIPVQKCKWFSSSTL